MYSMEVPPIATHLRHVGVGERGVGKGDVIIGGVVIGNKLLSGFCEDMSL